MKIFTDFLSIFCKQNSLNYDDILSQLQKYIDLLVKANEEMNLIGKSTIENIWTRHVLDSAQLLNYVSDKVLDLGSGSGMPAIIMAIIQPNLKIMLVEKSPKKCNFLQNSINDLSLEKRVFVLNKEAYDAKSDIIKFSAKYITCRAFKPLNEIIKLINFYKISADLILLKGKNVQQEISTIDKNIKYKLFNSIADKDSFVVAIKL